MSLETTFILLAGLVGVVITRIILKLAGISIIKLIVSMTQFVKKLLNNHIRQQKER
jgi:hypothetical protein